MKKLILFLSLLLTLLLSACSTPAYVTVVDYDVTYKNIDVYDEDIYVRLFRLYLPNNEYNQEYNYGFQVKTNKDITVSYSCSDSVVYSNNINVLFYKNLTQTLSPNFFVGECVEGDELLVKITDKNDDILYSHSSTYLSLRATYFAEDTYPLVPSTEFSNWNYLIAITPILLLFVVSILSYRIYYKRKINTSFQDESPNEKQIMDLNTFKKLAIMISLVLLIAVPVLVKIIYDKTVIQHINYEDRSLGILDIDVSDITLTEIRYERLIVEFNSAGRITTVHPPYINDLPILYNEISESLLSILNEYNNTPVSYYKFVFDYYTDSGRYYIIELETSDEARIIIKFTVPSYASEEYILEIFYVPPFQSHSIENGFMTLYIYPIYFFTVPSDNQDVIELYNILINSE